MKFANSQKILGIINKNNYFVLFCHEGPDVDSILSCLVMKKVLDRMGKKCDIFSPDPIGVQNQHLDSEKLIKIKNPNEIDLSSYDVIFALDVNELSRYKIKPGYELPKSIINIDHHENKGLGDLAVNEPLAGATCGVLYYVLKEWGIKMDRKILDMLLLGIVSDTDVFHFSVYSSSFIFNTVAELIDLGGDYEKALYYADQCYSIGALKFWGEAISAIEIDHKHKFAYTVIPFSIYSKYEKQGISARQVSDGIMRKINDTDFGMVIIGNENGTAKVSIRTRTPGFYVLDLIKELGGGGHLTGGGATVSEKSFDKAVEKVLETARKYAKTKSG